MLAAQNRMRDSRDFQTVRRNGFKVVLPGLIMHIYVGIYQDFTTRVGLTVGKDCGNSVQRHRASRRIRAAIKPVVEQLPIGTGLVIKALPSIHDFSLDSALITDSLLSKVKS